MNIDGLSVKELQNLVKKASDTIQVRAEQEKSAIKQRLQDEAKKAGYTIEELFGGKSSKRRAKVAPKYRDPSDASNTWTGRGRMPKWLQAKVEAGENKDKFLIK